MASLPDPHVSSLAKQAREVFVVEMARAVPDLARSCLARLSGLLDQVGPAREMQLRRDAWADFQKHQSAWDAQTRKALQRSLLPRFTRSGTPQSQSDQLELVAVGAMDDQILASRLAMRVLDLVSTELNELRLRVQHLEGRTELPCADVLLPDVTARILVDQWFQLALTREAWQLVQDALAPELAGKLLQAYKAANAFLIDSGVMKEIDLQALVRRAPDARGARAAEQAPDTGGRSTGSGLGAVSAGWGASAPAASAAGVHEETRLMTRASPLSRARMRAQGLVGRLKRLLLDQVGGDFEATQRLAPSPRLQQLIERSGGAPSGAGDGGGGGVVDALQVERAVSALRQRSNELKQAAATPTEKATVEVVALMFQSILAEERIAPSARLWFARLQMPVLRVALAEPEFFSALQHPARRLIDRMGSCVLGFESNVGSAALEAEIKRVVQVVEQYPETGSKVFRLVLDEFQTFIAAFLSETGSASRYVGVAQQVEEKETLAIRYTIELRQLLEGLPVRHELRDFLFKIWADVLALASVKYGQKHADTDALKRVATDLLWAASAKPNRSERARVIQQLPGLLQRLRQGMGLLGFSSGVQDQHIKSISDLLADAFMSRTEALAPERLDHLAQRLAQLEDFLPPGGDGDLKLDSHSIEMITGVDASNIEVIHQGGSQPNAAMQAWAAELQIGCWFGLDHNGALHQVQLAWRSKRSQLYLFAGSHGRCFLIQAARVAAYLQAGLLLPSEEEALTVRATRAALLKLDANPERLLA